MTFTQIIDLKEGKRYRCPYCDSSDGFAVGDDGDKGWMHCFSCRVHGDGIHYLRDIEGYSFQEAAQALDYPIPDRDVTRAARRHQERRGRAQVFLMEPLSEEEKRRVEANLTEADKELILEYAHRWITAETPEEVLKWTRKHEQVYRIRLAKLIDEQRQWIAEPPFGS